MIEDVTVVDRNTVKITVLDRGEKKARLGEILPALFGVPVEELEITRLNMFGWREGWVDPLHAGFTGERKALEFKS